MNTRKHPRTLNEAFGPYISNYIEDEEDTAGKLWAAAIFAGIFFVALVAVVFL